MEHFDAGRIPRMRWSGTASRTPRSSRRCSCGCSSCRRGTQRYDVSSLQGGHPRRRAVPGRREAADHRVARADRPRVLRRHRGQRLRLLQQRAVARPPRHGRACRSAAACTSSARTARSSPPARSARCTSRAAATFEYHNDPDKTRASRHAKGWTHARRRRLPRRGRVPVPHRPQGVHDHQRRREHLSAGGRERARRPIRR